MSEFQPYFTADGSVGLFSNDFNDIYHSSYGALSEAYEKFILPINFHELLQKDEIKILDICYGIGYNSKSFLNYIFEKYYDKKNYSNFHNTEAIYSDNKISKLDSINIEKIYGDNIFSKISITAIDNDELLIFLSPFIKTGCKKIKEKLTIKNIGNISKYLNKKNIKKDYKIHKIINYLFLFKICQKFNNIYTHYLFNNTISDHKFNKYFIRDLKGIFEVLKTKHNKTLIDKLSGLLLHNIYYNHISQRYKNILKRYNLLDINFRIEIDDARKVIKKDDNKYNIVFLDAFTPTKCPCLWSLEFFEQIYKHMEPDGLLLTYSKAATVRAAMLEAGFYVGYNYDKKNMVIGTIASKEKSQIKYPLSEYDLGLTKTKAGIFYRDENLNALNEAIIEHRNLEVKNSKKISASKYIKQYHK